MKTKAMDRCLRYMQKKINSGIWKPNESIPKIVSLTKEIGVSRVTVRKAIAKLERDKIIDNQGSLGFILKSNKIISLKNKSLTYFYLDKLTTNIGVLKLLKSGGKQIGQFIIQYDTTSRLVHFVNITEGKLRSILVDDLLEIFNNPISLETVLSKKGSSFNKYHKQFKKQQILHPIAKTVVKNKKQLGII